MADELLDVTLRLRRHHLQALAGGEVPVRVANAALSALLERAHAALRSVRAVATHAPRLPVRGQRHGG